MRVLRWRFVESVEGLSAKAAEKRQWTHDFITIGSPLPPDFDRSVNQTICTSYE